MEPLEWMALASLIGGGIGFLSQDEVKAPGMVSDEDIQREMPDVWRMIQQNKARIAASQQALDARRSGPTQLEQMQMAGQKGQQQSEQAQRGLLGTSVGNAQTASMSAQLQAHIAERAFQEEMQRRNEISQSEQQAYQNVAGARNQLMAQRAGKYQADMGNQQAANQFYGGLMSAGIGMGANSYISGQNREAAYKMRGLNPDGSRPQIVDSFGSTGDFGRRQPMGNYYGDVG